MRNYALLIRKDFIAAAAGYPFLPVLAVVCLAVLAIAPSGAPMIFCITIYILVVAIFQTEENDLVCNVIGILPIRKRQAVIARYLYAYSILLLEIVLACLTGIGRNLVTGRSVDWPIYLLIAASAALLLFSITAPLIYKFGVNKSRYFIMIFYMIMIVFASSSTTAITQISISPNFHTPFMAAVLGVVFLLSLLSMGISIAVKK